MLYREQTFAPRAFHSELQQQTNTVNTQKSPPWACDKGCAEACAERFSALNFSLGYPRWWKKTVPSFQAWMSSLQSSWKTKWRPTVPSVSCKLVLILERLRGEIDLKIAGKMILIVKELFNSTKLTNCWLISWISGLVWKADGASTTRFVEAPSIFEVFYVDHDAD